MTPFPWQEAMRFGLGVLRLSPDAFWGMSPRELAAAVAGLSGPAGPGRPIERSRFDQLQQLYPDHTSEAEPDNV